MDKRAGNFSFVPRLKAKYLSLKKLEKINPPNNPWEFFEKLFKKALKREPEPNASVLCTAGPNGRVVLIKKFDPEFWFFTSAFSKKVREIKRNPRGALVFYWPSLCCQIRVAGKIKKLKKEICVSYFNIRPVDAKVAVTISRQSHILKNWTLLMKNFLKILASDPVIECPKHWIGYSLCPTSFEFWFGSSSRLHRRFHYSYRNHKWTLKELCP
ncbi:MAG: pyridoxal 5'-phosphate synthase [Deltaproteobacteria bacterium]|nr:pyridoxal 5'-phosphate synthase [Deltaproteobacteria bacterium]